MTKPSDKKPSGSTQGRSRASAKKVDTTPASATETKKPQSKARTPAKKPAAASSAKSSDTKAAPAVAKAPRVRSSAAAKKPESAPAPAPETAPVAAGAAEPGKSSTKERKPRSAALAKKSLADAQALRESQAAAEAGPSTDAETSPRDRNRIEGARLIKMIRKVIIERGLQDRTIADIVGVTQIYWNSLANGNRQIKSLGKEKLQKIAEFLGLPLIQVYLLAEHFTAEDFFNEQLWLSVRKMQEDPQWAGYAPSLEEWEQTPINVRITLVSLYERESKRYLMAKAEVEVPGNNFTE